MFYTFLIGALFASVALAAPRSPPVLIHPNGINNKCLDVRGDTLANGTPVQIYDCNGTGAQKWLMNVGETKIQLENTIFCLDAGSNPANFVKMKIWTCLNVPAQDWFYTQDLRIALTGQGQCLDLTDGILTNGNPIQTFQCTNSNRNQIWTTTPA